MPNWCYNSAIIRHDDPTKIAELLNAAKEGNWFEHFLPVPEKIIEPTDPDLLARGITTMGDAEYSWRVDHWGTKWDAAYLEVTHAEEKETKLIFETAWSPPLGIYERLKELGYYIEAEYYEPGCCFVGRWIDGDDECYEIGSEPKYMAGIVPPNDDEEAA